MHRLTELLMEKLMEAKIIIFSLARQTELLIYEQTDGQKDGRKTNEQTNEQIDGQTDGQTNRRQTNEQTG